MKAKAGDWLIVHSHNDGGHIRKAEILRTNPGGQTPFTVRWLDDDKESVVFPGPDAEIVAAAEQEQTHRADAERFDRVQSAIEGRRHE